MIISQNEVMIWKNDRVRDLGSAVQSKYTPLGSVIRVIGRLLIIDDVGCFHRGKWPYF